MAGTGPNLARRTCAAISNGDLRVHKATSNENKMSDGGRDRGSLAVEVWTSSQKWSVQRSAVRSIAWLDVRSPPVDQPTNNQTADTAEDKNGNILVSDDGVGKADEQAK